MTEEQQPHGNDEDPWALERERSDLVVVDQLPAVSLHDKLIEAANLRSYGDEEPKSQIAVRVVPPGLRAVMGEIAHRYLVSYSALTYHALDIGLTILNEQPWILAVRRAYYDNRADAISSGDPEALARLDQPVHYQFQRSQPYRTTLATSRPTAARVAELASVCGIHTPALAILTIVEAVLGLPNRRGSRTVLIAEVEAFERSVIRRTRVLRLGE